MTKSNCKNCAFRKKYDRSPESILGKLWKWHIKFCPGWRNYFTALPQPEKIQIKAKYNL